MSATRGGPGISGPIGKKPILCDRIPQKSWGFSGAHVEIFNSPHFMPGKAAVLQEVAAMST
jgi:hypothetical protein